MHAACALVALSILALTSTPTRASPARMPAECFALLARDLPGWKDAAPSAEVAAWAKKKGNSPVVATGDFDGDARADWATIGSVEGKGKLVLCVGAPAARSLAISEDQGCSDYVYTIKRKTKVPNLDTGGEEVLRRDTAATGCFEKSGRVFLYEGGSFRVFFNSD